VRNVFMKLSLLTASFRRRRVFQHLLRKKGITVFVDFHKGPGPLVCSAWRAMGPADLPWTAVI
jgi:hypothetical protein